jgi:hypothetical protein
VSEMLMPMRQILKKNWKFVALLAYLNPFGFYNNPQVAFYVADATKTCNHYEEWLK